MPTLDVIAIGRLSGELQTPVQRLREIVTELRIEPTAIINNIEHFDRIDAERIAMHIRSTHPRSGPSETLA